MEPRDADPDAEGITGLRCVYNERVDLTIDGERQTEARDGLVAVAAVAATSIIVGLELAFSSDTPMPLSPGNCVCKRTADARAAMARIPLDRRLLAPRCPVASAALFWGSWGWVAVAAAVAVMEYATPQRSQRFSARVWRSLRVGRRSSRERATETLYVITAVAGVVLLVIAVLSAV
jgi:hypothetical protein